MQDLTLYSMPSSGNSYKVRLLLALLGRAYTRVDCEVASPELEAAHAGGHLPFGKAPALHLPDGTVLSESGAILWYLGEETPWVPADPLARAQTLAWMFFEQNRHEPVVAVRASLLRYPHRAADATPEALATLLEDGHAVLAVMEQGLDGQPFFGGTSPTLADIALYGYTHTAGTYGGFDMTRFPRIDDWCAAIAALPGYVTLEHA
ncbi:MAG: glutathione S-transferase family protein [Pseudomonadota bacterium]